LFQHPAKPANSPPAPDAVVQTAAQIPGACRAFLRLPDARPEVSGSVLYRALSDSDRRSGRATVSIEPSRPRVKVPREPRPQNAQPAMSRIQDRELSRYFRLRRAVPA